MGVGAAEAEAVDAHTPRDTLGQLGPRGQLRRHVQTFVEGLDARVQAVEQQVGGNEALLDHG